MAYRLHIKCSIVHTGRTLSQLNRFCRGNGYLASKAHRCIVVAVDQKWTSPMPFLTKIKELFKQLVQRDMKEGNALIFIRYFLVTNSRVLLSFTLRAPDILRGSSWKWIRKVKWFHRREEKYGSFFLHRLINKQKVEMEAWICLYTLIKKAQHFHFWGMWTVWYF